MLFINYRTQRRRALPCPFAVSAGVGLPAILPVGPDKHPGGGPQGNLRRRLPGAAPAVQYGRQRAAARIFCASISFMVYALPCVLPAYHGAVWHTIPYFSIREKFYFGNTA